MLFWSNGERGLISTSPARQYISHSDTWFFELTVLFVLCIGEDDWSVDWSDMSLFERLQKLQIHIASCLLSRERFLEGNFQA